MAGHQARGFVEHYEKIFSVLGKQEYIACWKVCSKSFHEKASTS